MTELLNLFKDYFLHLDQHLTAFVGAASHIYWVYGLLFAIIFAETGFVVTPFLPGDSLLFAAGAIGALNPALLIPLLAAAAILGDTVNYGAGHFIGPKVFTRPKSLLFNPQHLERAHRFYEKYGGKTIIIARFVPIIRTFAPFVAGIGRMSYAKFIAYNVIGGIGWVTILVLSGYWFGRLDAVKNNFGLVIMAIIVISVMPAVIEGYRAWLEKAGSAPQRKKRKLAGIIALIVVVLAAAAGIVVYTRIHKGEGSEPALESKPAPAFVGDSDELKQTIFVPTLDTPIPEGRNAIWCAAFPLAWKKLNEDVLKGPAKLANAQEIADRLNASPSTESDLPPGSFYVAAGRAQDGIAETIRKEMARRFPSVTPPKFDHDSELIAYSYLAAQAKFTIPYFDGRKALEFTDNSGNRTCLRSFGLFGAQADAYLKLREQVDVLYASATSDLSLPEEIILDLCKDSAPNQIILARIPRKETLAETLADLDAKVKSGLSCYSYHFLGPTDMLVIPEVDWTVKHHFTELEGPDKGLQITSWEGPDKEIQITGLKGPDKLNQGFLVLWLATARQDISFKLDRSGAEPIAETPVQYKADSREFLFDHPFLIVMKQRGCERPFFVMWVDNAELLCKWQSE